MSDVAAVIHGWCSICRRGPFTLLATGVVKTHGPRGNRCEGSLEKPAEPRAVTGPGWCSVCGRGPLTIVRAGVVRTHGPQRKRCPGSLTEPAARPRARVPQSLRVLALAATGLTDDQIGARLFVSPHTVKTHLMRVYAQLGARGRTDAVHIACHRGLLPCRASADSVATDDGSGGINLVDPSPTSSASARTDSAA